LCAAIEASGSSDIDLRSPTTTPFLDGHGKTREIIPYSLD
jgi:hypothetical protein